MGAPLYVICRFSLVAFNICSLCLILVNLINICLRVFHLGFILFCTLWVSWTWVTISFHILRKFSTIISSSIFFISFLFLVFFWDPYYSNVTVFDIVPEVSETILSCFHPFDFILCFRSYFNHFIFQLIDSFFCFRYSAIESF